MANGDPPHGGLFGEPSFAALYAEIRRLDQLRDADQRALAISLESLRRASLDQRGVWRDAAAIFGIILAGGAVLLSILVALRPMPTA